MFADTLMGNLRLAKPEATEAECRAAAERACCAGFVAQLLEGEETRLGEGGRDLSGGERQRVAIARAMLKDAEIVLLDKATSALDAESEHGVGAGLRALFQGRTVIMIAHRLQTVAQADHIVVMEAGRVVDSGPPAELQARCALYRDLWSAYHDTERWRLSVQAFAPDLTERGTRVGHFSTHYTDYYKIYLYYKFLWAGLVKSFVNIIYMKSKSDSILLYQMLTTAHAQKVCFRTNGIF